MKEHKQLKEICDIILYNTEGITFDNVFGIIRKIDGEVGFRILDVREIIFTQEFMDKLFDCLPNMSMNQAYIILGRLSFSHLDNPVQYLYTLILSNIKWKK